MNGYRLVYKPSHSKAMQNENWKGFVYEHIVVAEEVLGRPLRDGEDVHHLDCNRSNNRSENLIVLESSQHTKIHNWLRSGMKINKNDGIEKSVFCGVCGKLLRSDQKKYCSIQCNGQAQSNKNKPSKEELEELINNETWVNIGKKYGVSDNAARKWAVRYGIPLKNERKRRDSI